MSLVTEKIKALRKQAKLTLAEVSGKLGINASAYHKVELGQTPINLDRLFQLAEIFGVSAAELLGLGVAEEMQGREVVELEAKIKELEQIVADKESQNKTLMGMLDTVIKTLGAFALEELTSPEAKEKFREQIKKNVKNSTQTEANTDYMPYEYDYGLPPED